MYFIKSDEFTLYNPINADLTLSSPTLNLGVNKVGSLTFSMMPTHPCFNKVKKMESVITVYQDSSIIFRGRVFSDNVGFYKIKKVEVEGVLAYLNDSIIRPYNFTGGVREYLDFLISQHNEQVEPQQQFILGEVTVTDPNDYIIRANSNNPNTWSEITDKLINLLGGYICIRYEDDGNYIDYLVDYSDTSTQEIRFAVNLLDLESEVRGDNLATCLIPYGMNLSEVTEYQSTEAIQEAIDNNNASVEEIKSKITELKRKYNNKQISSEEYKSEYNNLNKERAEIEKELVSLRNALYQWDTLGGGNQRVTIKSVNNGVDYIQNNEAVSKYGKIYEVVTWDDVAEPKHLLTKARAYLQDKIKLSGKLSVKAIDLHLSDTDIEAFHIGDYIRVYSEPHGIDEIMLLTDYNLDLTNPAGFQFTLGLESNSFLDSQITSDRVINDNVNRIDEVSKEVDVTNDKITANLKETLQYINSVIDNSEQYVRQMLKDYRKTSDMEDITELVSTTFQQNADEIQIVFDKLSSTITSDVDGIYREFENISKYIRFTDGDILLGEVGNDMQTRISNGRISFEYNGLEVAYIKDDYLYIKSAEILDHLIIGNFAFIPRPNGNLSFKYIGSEEE